MPRWNLWKSMGIFAAGGGVLGALAGLARASLLHLPPDIFGSVVLRFTGAGLAIGASLPLAMRALYSILKAAVWWILTLVLWTIAASLLGQTSWITRWFQR